jgi:hypothetical protein
MIYFKPFLSVLVLGLVCTSCVTSEKLQRKLRKYSEPLAYHIKANGNPTSSKDTVYIRLSGDLKERLTSVKDLKGKIRPFLIINYVEKNYLVRIGQCNFYERYPDFLLSALVQQGEKNGSLIYSTDKPRSDSSYTLDVVVEECVTEAKICQKNMSFLMIGANGSTRHFQGEPAETRLVVKEQLRKGNALIREKTFTFQEKLNFQNKIPQKDLYKRFNANMVQSLSTTTKHAVENISADLNWIITGKR